MNIKILEFEIRGKPQKRFYDYDPHLSSKGKMVGPGFTTAPFVKVFVKYSGSTHGSFNVDAGIVEAQSLTESYYNQVEKMKKELLDMIQKEAGWKPKKGEANMLEALGLEMGIAYEPEGEEEKWMDVLHIERVDF